MSARLLLALALALGVQTVYANPAVSAAELRALSCCGHCPEPLSLPSARSCCGVTATASGPAEAPTTRVPAPPSGVVAALAAAVVSPPASWVRTTRVRRAGSGPPTFLAQRHLLL